MNLTFTLDPGAEMTQPKYEANHLEFRRDTIEPLSDDAMFEISTPAGAFRMTKGDFHAQFPEIASSVSYRDLGLYHYPMIPYKAFRFLVREDKAANLAGEPVDQQPDGVSEDIPEDRIDQIPGD
jgi:hypothetical protein